jgi:hypothetical protein
VQTPRLPYVLETACCWISSYKHSAPDGFVENAQRLLNHNIGIMQALQHPRNDPEVSVGCIELIQSFIGSKAQILTQQHPDILAGMFGFTIESVKSPEVLPKRAAAKLWKDVFELAGNSHSQHQATAQDIVNHFGPSITFALISNVCGEVDATSLDHIMVPLRTLLRSDKNARSYITSALAEQPLLQRYQQDTGVQDLVRKFIESLTRCVLHFHVTLPAADTMYRNAKNSTAFREAVKAFWQSCKQLQMQLQPQMMHPGHHFAQLSI